MSTLYERKILNEPEVHLSFGNPLVPIVSADNVTIELSNTDAFFDDLDLRGSLITYARFDEFSLEQLAELTGRVTSQTTLKDRVVLTTTVHDLGDLQTLIPKLTVDAVTFPKADPQQGLGKVIPIVFGLAASTNKVSDAWELPYVGEDIASNFYDYLVGKGSFANASVYRNTYGDTLFLVPGGEYSVNTTAYPGYTVIRFVLRQASFGGGMHRIFAAADSADYGRNFVTNAQALLSNATWGLGGSVNAASATAGAADMDSVGSMFCDGVMNVQRPAIDWLNQLLIVRGIKLDKNSAGEWTFAVDKLASTVQATFGHGKGQQWANVTDFGGLETTPESSAIKSLVLEYRKDLWKNNYVLATTARNPLANGKELRLQNEFIRNTTTGDKSADYIAKRLTYGDVKIGFGAGQEARRLRPGDLINYESMRPLFSKTLRVIDLLRGLTKTKLGTEGWNPAIYTYTPAALPAEPAAVTQTDNTRTAPTAASSLSIASSGVEADGQGGWSAFVVLQYTVPAETFAQTIIRKRRNGATNWEAAGGPDQATGAGLQTKVTGLITGAAYDYEISRVNAMAPSLSADVTLTNQTAPADAAGPAAPTSLAIVDQHLKTIKVKWVKPADNDIKYWHYEIRTAASGGGSLVVEGDTEGPGVEWSIVLNQIAYSTTRYLRVRGHDYSGNDGTYSASLSFSFTQIVTGDVGTDAVATAAVQDNAISDTAVYYTTGTTTIDTTETIVGNITVNADTLYGIVLLNAGFAVELAAGNALMELRIRKGAYVTDTQIGYGPAQNPHATITKQETIFVGAVDVSPAASQNYVLTAKTNGGSMLIGYRYLAGLSVKR